MSNKKFNARHGVSVGGTPVDVIDDTGAVLTNAATATKLLNSRTISISGDVVATGSFDGSGNLDLAATIQANSVALGTDTTGNYMVDVSAGTGVSVSHTQSEGSTATISIGQAVGTTDNVTFNNATLTGELRGPATFVIDPAAVGDNTGTLVIKGNLQVDGTTTTINSTTLTVDDLVLTLGGDTAPASDDTYDKGIEYRWFDTQARVGFFGFDRSTGKLTFIPQSTLSSGVYSGTTGEIDAKLDWSNVLNKPTIDNTTYNQLAVTTTGGALLRLNSSGAVNDDVKFASGTNVTVAYTDDNTITISSTDTDTVTRLRGTASGTYTSGDLTLISGSNVTVLQSGSNFTISAASAGDGSLSTTTTSAGLTNTDIALELSGAYSANTSTNRTIKAVVGPALTALATFMTTATAGFIKRTGQDTYGIDTSTYLTAESDTLSSVTGRGATTSTAITLSVGGNQVSTSTWEKWKLVTTGTTAAARQGSDANGLNFTTNALWNGSGWVEDDNTKKKFAYIQHLGNGRHEFRTAPTGANIAFVTTMYIDENAVTLNKPTVYNGSSSGNITLQAPAAAGTNTITMPASTGTMALTSDIANGTLGVSIGAAGATNTTVTWGTSTGFSANTASNYTYDLKVGPALTALATFMTTATAGFIKRTGQDTFGVDTNTYSTTDTVTRLRGTASGTYTSGDLTLLAGSNVTISQSGSDYTIAATTPGDGTLSVAAKSAGATNTDVTLELSGAYSANSSTSRTIKAVVGPALTALSTLMATAGAGFIKRGATADTYTIDTSTYLTSYSETSTLSDVTGRGATTGTDITLGSGVVTSTTNFGGTTTNYLITSSTGSLIVKTKDQTTTSSKILNIQTGNTTLAGSNSGGILIKTGNATGGSAAYAGDISMYPGTSDGVAAIVSIYGGESASGTTSTGGYITIKGGSSTTTTGTTTANGGNVYIYGGDVTSANNFTKNTGSIYMEGGGASGSGTITFGTINIGRTSSSSSYGTSAVNIGNASITTTIYGTVKLPTVGTSGFVKLGAGGQLSADTSTYLTANQSITLSGDASGTGSTAIAVTLANTAVTAGSYTYTSITVDSKGRITAASSGTAPSNTSVTATSPIVTSGATGSITLSHAASGVTAGTYNSVTVNSTGHVTGGTSNSYLTAEADTLSSVMGRGSSTSYTLTSTNTTPFAFQGNSNTGTYNQTQMYVNLNNTSGSATNGIVIERGRLTDSSTAEIRYFTIAARGGQIQWQVDGSGNTTQTGSLSATSKSFLIPHPTKEGWKLRYGSLEGPENGVYIRGKLKGKNKIELPEYWSKLVDPDSITVSLTPIGKHQKLYVEDIADNVVTIANDGLFAGEINCFFVVYGERVDIDKLVVEYE